MGGRVATSHPTTDAPTRSAVPDLLFEDVCRARVQDLAALCDDPAAIDATMPLHRVTVFVTYRCNLACSYCKTIVRSPADLAALPQRARSLDLAQFAALLAGHGDTPIEHLHFTGGEASLLRELPAMVTTAKAHGVRCVSITTNGTLPPSTYTALVQAGIDEIRVSIDDAHGGGCDAGELQPSTRGRSLATVRALGALRAAGAPFFLILNTVVERRNRARLPELLRGLLGLQPDDIKLITSVDEKDDLGAFADAPAVLAELQALLARHPAARFPLLRRKLDTVLARDAIGLATAQPASDGSWRCYIPLTERTVDGEFYYPCSVWLREGGAPLGRTDEPQAEQRRKSAAFTADHDCRREPICQRYCLHCTRQFNDAVNAARRPGAAP
jgi:molybdenum cofactor biosynthesis enzyme MoaA